MKYSYTYMRDTRLEYVGIEIRYTYIENIENKENYDIK